MPEEIDEIEEKLRQLKPEQLLKLIQELSRSVTLTDERRQELREISVLLIDEIKRSKEGADHLLKGKGREIVELINQLCKDNAFLPEKQRQELDRVASMIAGYLMRPWLPGGLTRKVLMFLLLIIGLIGALKWSLWFGLLIIFAATFSPRLVGESLLFIGTLSGNQRK
jgi:hypothetical protein